MSARTLVVLIACIFHYSIYSTTVTTAFTSTRSFPINNYNFGRASISQRHQGNIGKNVFLPRRIQSSQRIFVSSSKENEVTSTATTKKKKKKSSKKRKRKSKVSSNTESKARVSDMKAKAKRKARKKSSKKKRKSKTTGKKYKVDDKIYFFRNETDIIAFTSASNDVESTEFSMVRFKVRGNPVPLARHRTSRGFVFNPSAKKQQQFCSVVLDMLPDHCFEGNDDEPKITKSVDHIKPVFGEQLISVRIISRMKRPLKHFVGGIAGPGRLRTCSKASNLQLTRSDVDNFAKFVLDSLNGVLYQDDKQVASLQITKVYDDEEPYIGSTDVIVETMTEENLNDLANS
ncbi:hypothetical protein CTEN210_14817 [Chaetoceros tenuissimus]|uniref:Uncharacterized protein n=1 Tax=Chaetoceros tenuissimus TaxID=426638 RepID=A0AAD3D7Y3_9STRA|nr:hypothetical protein CTEN210_14817 [Chaetoceros tenuissimus]